MKSTASKKTRRKRCSECGELKDDVQGRQKICERCEENMRYCKICDEWTHIDSEGCRHVGWDSDIGCDAGCGTWDIDADAHKESFMALLACLERETTYIDGFPLLPELLKHIDAGTFWTQWRGPMIGAAPDLTFRYCDGRSDWFPTFAEISSETQESWGNIQGPTPEGSPMEWSLDHLQLGMTWLTSLDEQSTEANKITAGWIREWMIAI